MARTPVWKSIAATLEQDITDGHYRAGDKLPTEIELSKRFGVNRHTVRHALADLGERGIVRSRRGSGVFVEAPPTDYPIGRRVRFHRAIEASGRLPARQMLRLERRKATPHEAAQLAIRPEDPVLLYEGLTLSGDVPIGLFISLFPLDRLPDMEAALGQTASITEALRICAIPDYTRRATRLKAELATATQALHLRLREGDPVLKSDSVNIDPSGVPVEYGICWFAGDRVTLTLTPD